MSFFLALITALFWSTGDIFFGLTARKIGAKLCFFLILGIASIIMLLPGLYFFPVTGINLTVLFITIFISFIHITGTYAYITSLEKGNAIINGVIAGSFSIVTVILSVYLFKEILKPVQIAAIIISLLGIILSALNRQDLITKEILNKGSLYALIAMLLWGVYFTLVKIPTRMIGWYWPAFFIRVLVFLFIPFLISKKELVGHRFAIKKLFIFIFAGAILSAVGDVIYNLGISSSNISYFAPIASLSPVFYVLIASSVYRDKIATMQKLGIIIALGGIIMINF